MFKNYLRSGWRLTLQNTRMLVIGNFEDFHWSSWTWFGSSKLLYQKKSCNKVIWNLVHIQMMQFAVCGWSKYKRFWLFNSRSRKVNLIKIKHVMTRNYSLVIWYWNIFLFWLTIAILFNEFDFTKLNKL